MENCLIIMAKKPEPGQVKTRMIPALSAGNAAELYRCLLEDTINMISKMEGIVPGLAFTPSSAEGYFRKIVPARFLLLSQPEGNLGQRITKVFKEAFSMGARAVCLMNSDGPDLPQENIIRAFQWLNKGKADIVFGPNYDGGYYLVGTKRWVDIFGNIPWSNTKTLNASIEAAREAGLRYRLLSNWPDLDTVEDLREALNRWQSDPERKPGKTGRFLLKLRSEGKIL